MSCSKQVRSGTFKFEYFFVTQNSSLYFTSQLHNKTHMEYSVWVKITIYYYTQNWKNSSVIYIFKPYCCLDCTNMLCNTWTPSLPHILQPCYQYVTVFVYWCLFFTYNKWKTVNFNNKYTSSEQLNDIHKVVLDAISNNMDALIDIGRFIAISTTDQSKNDSLCCQICL